MILHPRRLVIAAVVTSSSFSAYKDIYTHDFRRNLYNFTIGNFGGKPTICVQSVDGALFFVRHDKQICQIQLPNFLVPSVIAYLPNADCVVVGNSNFELECYNF